MIEWQPKLPQKLTLDKPQADKEFNKKRRILLIIGGLGLGGMFIAHQSSPLFMVIIVVVFSLFVIFYLRYRTFFQSYLYTYENKRNRFYYEDYSLRDSFVIGSLLILGIILIFIFLFLFYKPS